MKLRFLKTSSLGISAMLVAACSYAVAQTAPPTSTQDAGASAQRQMSTQNLKLVSANARLTHDLNAKDASQGQVVKARLTSDVKTANGMKLDKGTVLTGKVAQVQGSSDNGPSRLSVVFNEARLKDGKTIPVKATLLGAYPSSAGSYYPGSGMTMMMGTEPHSIPADQKILQEPGTLSHIAMRSAVQSDVSGTFTSTDRDVNLKRGTRLQIAIATLTGAGTVG